MFDHRYCFVALLSSLQVQGLPLAQYEQLLAAAFDYNPVNWTTGSG